MVSDGTFTFAYDGLNRLTQVNKQTTTVATYGYDSSNRRVRKTVGTTITHYLYDLNNHLIAETLNGTKIRDYIYLDGEPFAIKEYKTNPGIYYFVNDHLGTPQQLVTAAGTVVWQAAYLPFGKAQVTIETVKNNLRFPGQYYDSETGLHYNWNRFYDPDTGRYVTADPLGLDGGMNLYAYVGGDPVNGIDPFGLYCKIEWREEGVFVIDSWIEEKKIGYDDAVVKMLLYYGSKALFRTYKIKTPPIPDNAIKFKYQMQFSWYQNQDYYINYYEVCYDDCTGERISSKLLDGIQGKSNKVEKVLLDRWYEDRYL